MSQHKYINLALQGGGAHGAFTWGVLDAILADERVSIDEISGTSAGAMNAVVLASGYQKNGREGARKALAEFWQSISGRKSWGTQHIKALDGMFGSYNMFLPHANILMDLSSRIFSPYDTNPLNINPLKDIIEDTVDFTALATQNDIGLHIAATHVHSGKVRIFSNENITCQSVLASACLPMVFQAVEIEKEPYWDGGYMGNPSLFPLFKAKKTKDIVLVQINPIMREQTPKKANEIIDRINEITFNASLHREFRAISFVQRLIEDGALSNEHYANILMHRIDADEDMKSFGAASKMNTRANFILKLFELGQATGRSWLKSNFDKLNSTQTLDLRAEIG